MKIGIFNSFDGIHEKVVAACKDLGVEYEVVDILSADWIKNVKESNVDGFFCPSNYQSQEKKSILDERYYFVSQLMKRPIYPDFLSGFIHESKRNMASWLELYGYPHPKTRVFTNKLEALNYAENCSYPFVTKANVGSAASKVIIIKTKRQARRMITKCFTWFEGKKALLNLPFHSYYYKLKYKCLCFRDRRNPQKDYFIAQDYVENVQHEWRILKVGNSYFGHQKLLKGEFASGSGLVGWVAPPKELLYMVKELCEKGGFPCMDVDIFENDKGEYYINELQSFFGSFLDYQMRINDVPGRYIFKDGDFIFEEGEFNKFGSNRLKIENFIEILSGAY